MIRIINTIRMIVFFCCCFPSLFYLLLLLFYVFSSFDCLKKRISPLFLSPLITLFLSSPLKSKMKTTSQHLLKCFLCCIVLCAVYVELLVSCYEPILVFLINLQVSPPPNLNYFLLLYIAVSPFSVFSTKCFSFCATLNPKEKKKKK